MATTPPWMEKILGWRTTGDCNLWDLKRKSNNLLLLTQQPRLNLHRSNSPFPEKSIAHIMPVLVLWGCNKAWHSRWHEQLEHLFSQSLEAGSPRSGVLAGLGLSEDHDRKLFSRFSPESSCLPPVCVCMKHLHIRTLFLY